MNNGEPVLEFAEVSSATPTPGDAALIRASARFMPGTIAVIRLEEGGGRLPIADLAEGLLVPDAGRVLFLGEDWRSMSPDQALRRRALIGRVFGERGWISNLTVRENIVLSQRHHTCRSEREIMDEAGSLARAFGLGGVPGDRPALVHPRELRRAEWIRAFLGRPALVLLEYPARGVPREDLPRLLGAVRDACARGAAVLWLAGDERIGRRAELPPVARYAVRASALEEIGDE